jgi:hypothetical protein
MERLYLHAHYPEFDRYPERPEQKTKECDTDDFYEDCYEDAYENEDPYGPFAWWLDLGGEG